MWRDTYITRGMHDKHKQIADNSYNGENNIVSVAFAHPNCVTLSEKCIAL